MQLRHILGAAAVVPMVLADSSSPGLFNCGAGNPPPKIIGGLNNLRTKEGVTKRAQTTMDYEADIVVPVYLHAVTKVGNPMDPRMMEKQWLVLQDSYAQYGIHFNLKGATTYEDDKLSYFNSTRFYGDMDNDDRMWYIGQTRKGSYDSLNIWFYEGMEDDMNGICTFPHDADPTESLWRDGCHVLAGTMPGGAREKYNVGYTAVHEAGHWLGLLHPWGNTMGSCDDDGDLVDDTPAQSEPAFGCPANTDTCPTHPGFDNAWNFMDYADDTCTGEQYFTPGQRTRMHHSYMYYRYGK